MSWSALFTLTNLVTFAGWAMLAFLPRSRTVNSIIMFACVGLLCLAGAVVGAFALPGRVVEPPDESPVVPEPVAAWR